MTVAVRVQARITGQRRSPVGEHNLDLQLPAGPVVLSDFLTAVVRAEVADHERRAEERTLLRVLTPQALQQELDAGRVLPGGADPTGPVDVDAAVETALLAYAAGLFKVFVDDVEVADVDEFVNLQGTPTVLFLRLVPLAGG